MKDVLVASNPWVVVGLNQLLHDQLALHFGASLGWPRQFYFIFIRDGGGMFLRCSCPCNGYKAKTPRDEHRYKIINDRIPNNRHDGRIIDISKHSTKCNYFSFGLLNKNQPLTLSHSLCQVETYPMRPQLVSCRRCEKLI